MIDRPSAPSATGAQRDPPGGPADPIQDAIRISVAASRRARVTRRTIVLVARAGLVVVALAAWEVMSRAGILDVLFFSRPSLIWSLFAHQPGQFLENMVYTLEAVAVGFLLSSIAGILAGVLLARFQGLSDVAQPIIVFLNSLPRIALVPLFILWFGISFQAKVATAFSLVFFIVLVNTQVGLATVDRELLLVTRLLGGSRRQVYMKVALPSAVPSIFGGLRLGVTYSILGVVASEMVASRNGLGQLITSYGQNLESAGVFATLGVLGILASIISALLGFVEQRLSSWKVTRDDR